jgi:hypothetical protein
MNKAEAEQRGRQDERGFQFSANVAVHFQRPPATRHHAISFSVNLNVELPRLSNARCSGSHCF